MTGELAFRWPHPKLLSKGEEGLKRVDKLYRQLLSFGEDYYMRASPFRRVETEAAYDIDFYSTVMPIEIKELHIKAVVSAGNNAAPQAVRQEDMSKLKKEIIKEVTAKVMKTLKQKNER